MIDARTNEIVGCIHIHSTYSDGSGTISEIAREAAEAGLNYILVTDHNNLRALQKGEEGWHGPVFVAIGYEINDVNDANHYLAFGLKEEVPRFLTAPEYVAAVNKAGGFGFIAHPDEQRHIMPEHPSYPWTAWECDDFQGMEIWNQMSEWMEGLHPWNQLWRYLNPRKSVSAPNPKTMERWDRLNRRRKVVGIGGVDAHAHKHSIFGGLFKLTIFRYKVLFKSVRTHLLLDGHFEVGSDPETARRLIYDSLREGRAFISNYVIGDARGFRFQAENNLGSAGMGESLPYTGDTSVVIELPHRGEIHLVQNGEQKISHFGRQVRFKIDEPGIYRTEIYRDGRVWILSNHIRIEEALAEFD